MKVQFKVILMILLSSFPIFLGEAMAGGSVKVAGKIEAVEVSSQPQTFVLTTGGVKGKELTVGCRLDDKTVLKAGKHATKLKDFRPGERVHLTYLRVEDGLLCQKIEKP